LIKEGKGDGVISALGKVGDEINALGVDGSARADGDNHQAHVGANVLVLVAA
jgi:hypothetical protein